ncbi:hypothetical protein MLD38_008718 [Melastoma candidum]|uniref:Uncharacterized protein n=1 Tax=Melastoma candidum TaxID=119954 RepID=A0ACB9RYY3_9MYRT|nr:hypothetical protein MLD38_008718 [Melastoma candidum]
MGTATLKQIVVVMMVVVVLFAFEHGRVSGAGECGRASSPDMEAMRLAPCLSAAQCDSPSFECLLCSGIKPEVAVTIPKRCNLEDRPVVTSADLTLCPDCKALKDRNPSRCLSWFIMTKGSSRHSR